MFRAMIKMYDSENKKRDMIKLCMKKWLLIKLESVCIDQSNDVAVFIQSFGCLISTQVSIKPCQLCEGNESRSIYCNLAMLLKITPILDKLKNITNI